MDKYFIGNTLVSEGVTPACKECGKELSTHHKVSNVFIIDGCVNPNCKAFGGGRKRYWSIFGEEEYKKRVENFRKTRQTTLEYWINKGFPKEEATEILRKNQSKVSKSRKTFTSCTKESILEKTGDECKTNKFFKERSRFCVDYWIKRGYSKNEAILKIKNIQTKFSKMQKPNNSRTWTQIGYWIKMGYTEDEAKKILSEKQRTFTKEKCIEKYGKEVGIEKWRERQEKWQKTLHDKQNLHVGYSKISQELFKSLLERYDEKERDYVFFGSHNHEYSLMEDKQNYIFDFTDLNRRKIIEFNGDIYHANPNIFGEEDRPNPFKRNKTSVDLWEFDDKKKKVAEMHNFQELVVWEKEYREHKEEIINKCIEFLGI